MQLKELSAGPFWEDRGLNSIYRGSRAGAYTLAHCFSWSVNLVSSGSPTYLTCLLSLIRVRPLSSTLVRILEVLVVVEHISGICFRRNNSTRPFDCRKSWLAQKVLPLVTGKTRYLVPSSPLPPRLQGTLSSP